MERAQGGDQNRKASFSFKASRNLATNKQLEELQTRLDAAHADWHLKVQAAAQLRADLLQTIRPGHVARFMEAISEGDANIVHQLHRFGKVSTDNL